MWPRRVAILGAGTMGSGFAHVFALAGIPVSIADATPERSARARADLVDRLYGYEEQGLFRTGAAKAVEEAVDVAGSVAEAVAAADYMVEAVTEDPAVKARVFAEVEEAASTEAVIASNTSAIPIADLATSFREPSRFLGTHWFNPPQWIPGVEIIPSEQTAGEVCMSGSGSARSGWATGRVSLPTAFSSRCSRRRHPWSPTAW